MKVLPVPLIKIIFHEIAVSPSFGTLEKVPGRNQLLDHGNCAFAIGKLPRTPSESEGPIFLT